MDKRSMREEFAFWGFSVIAQIWQVAGFLLSGRASVYAFLLSFFWAALSVAARWGWIKESFTGWRLSLRKDEPIN